jgi:hypothetical protein
LLLCNACCCAIAACFPLICLEFVSPAGLVLQACQYILKMPRLPLGLRQSPCKTLVRMLSEGLALNYFGTPMDRELPDITRFHFRPSRDLLLRGPQ